MNKPDFSNAKVGDEVESYRFGKGKISNICDSVYPIRVRFHPIGEAAYMLDGRLTEHDRNPDLFWPDVQFTITGGDVPPKRKVIKEGFIGMKRVYDTPDEAKQEGKNIIKVTYEVEE